MEFIGLVGLYYTWLNFKFIVASRQKVQLHFRSFKIILISTFPLATDLK